jgi:uncharacterized membrane protein
MTLSWEFGFLNSIFKNRFKALQPEVSKIEAGLLLYASKYCLDILRNLSAFAWTVIAGALAAALLLIRDRLTLRREMSERERDEAIEQNTARTLHWWHTGFLILAIVAVVLDFRRTGHQPGWFLLDIAVVAIIVFKYYRDRSEGRIEPRRSSKA